jgi:hypothetical protein
MIVKPRHGGNVSAPRTVRNKQVEEKMQKRQSTQWTAQFLAAAELCRRNYTVSFTTGNRSLTLSPGKT